ncbi:MAG: preprotein translocase subunit YajC [Microlunatus sp.]|nr:preprotein translocase subunit YajC [Microlunatus sp.]
MGSSPLSTILLIALMVVAFYFLLLRPQKKRQQAQQKTMNQTEPGTMVLLGSGFFGTVVSVGEKRVVLEIGPGIQVTVLKQAIARIVQPGDEFSEPDPIDEIEDYSNDPGPVASTEPDDTFRPSSGSYDNPAAADPAFGNERKNKD